jgi:hypothetical protein
VQQTLRGRSTAWQHHVTAELERIGGTPQDKVLSVFDLLGEWIAAPGYHGCPFINAEAESRPDAPGHQVNLQHRSWVRQLFAGLLRAGGVANADDVARQLTVLYDGAMAAAHAEPDQPWASDARAAARVLVTTAS